MNVVLVLDSLDRHGEGCGCGVCDTIGKSYGVGVYRVNDLGAWGTDDVVDRVFAASSPAAYTSAHRISEARGWTVQDGGEG